MELEIKNLEKGLDDVALRFKEEVAGIRGNRPTTKLVEDIKVDYFGQKLPIKQLGSISVVLPREIQISVWDGGAVAAVAKAIESASIGINPSVQGNLIRVNLPPLSEERRKELIKLVGSLAEKYRIQIRSLRDDYNKKIKKAESEDEINEDDKFKFLGRIQKAVDAANGNIENYLGNKIKEIES